LPHILKNFTCTFLLISIYQPVFLMYMNYFGAIL